MLKLSSYVPILMQKKFVLMYIPTQHYSFDQTREIHGFLVKGSKLIASGFLGNQKKV